MPILESRRFPVLGEVRALLIRSTVTILQHEWHLNSRQFLGHLASEKQTILSFAQMPFKYQTLNCLVIQGFVIYILSVHCILMVLHTYLNNGHLKMSAIQIYVDFRYLDHTCTSPYLLQWLLKLSHSSSVLCVPNSCLQNSCLPNRRNKTTFHLNPIIF